MSGSEELERDAPLLSRSRSGFYKRILESLGDPVCAFDIDGRLEFVGTEAAMALGTLSEKLLGKRWGELGCPVDTAAVVGEQIRKVIKGGVPVVDCRARLLSEDAPETTYSITPRFGRNGTKNGAVMSIHSPGVQEDHHLEREGGSGWTVAEQGSTYRDVLDSICDRVYVFDMECRYVFVGEYALRRSGMHLRLGEIIGKHWSQLGFPADIMVPFERDLRKVIRTGLPVVNRSSASASPDLLTEPLDYTLSPLRNPDNEIEGVVAIARPVLSDTELEGEFRAYDSYRAGLHGSPDVEERGWVPQSLENWVAQQRLGRETTRLHRALIRSISHDFRVPLTGAIAGLREIAEEAESLPPGVIKELAATGKNWSRSMRNCQRSTISSIVRTWS